MKKLPETNIAPENRLYQKETIVFQPFFFRGYVKLREGTWKKFWVFIDTTFGLPPIQLFVRNEGFRFGTGILSILKHGSSHPGGDERNPHPGWRYYGRNFNPHQPPNDITFKTFKNS